jgi:hypothetical protein
MKSARLTKTEGKKKQREKYERAKGKGYKKEKMI